EDVLADANVLDEVVGELGLARPPVRLPVVDDADAEAAGVHFLAHQATASFLRRRVVAPLLDVLVLDSSAAGVSACLRGRRRGVCGSGTSARTRVTWHRRLRMASTRRPGPGPFRLLARTPPRPLRLRHFGEDEGHVARPLADAVDAAARARLPALQRRPLIRVRGLDNELVAVEAMIGLGVRDRGAEHLLDVRRGGTRREGEDRPRLGDAAPTDVVEHETRLARGRTHPFRLRADAHPIVLDGSHQRLFTWVAR